MPIFLSIESFQVDIVLRNRLWLAGFAMETGSIGSFPFGKLVMPIDFHFDRIDDDRFLGFSLDEKGRIASNSIKEISSSSIIIQTRYYRVSPVIT